MIIKGYKLLSYFGVLIKKCMGKCKEEFIGKCMVSEADPQTKKVSRRFLVQLNLSHEKFVKFKVFWSSIGKDIRYLLTCQFKQGSKQTKKLRESGILKKYISNIESLGD